MQTSVREIWERLKTALRVPPGETLSTLPSAAERTNVGIGSLLGFDPITGQPAVYPISPQPFLLIASQVEAEAGSINDRAMSPLRTKQQINARIASEAEAAAGIDNTKLMTPLRTHQSWIDSAHGQIKLGQNLRPNPLYDSDPILTGRTNILIGRDQLTNVNDRATVSVIVGYGAAEHATDVYGLTAIGFRNASMMNGCGYMTALDIDAMSFTTTGNNSTAVGAHCGTHKTTVNASFIGGAFAAMVREA